MSEMVVIKDNNEQEYKVEIGKILYGQRCRILSEVMKVKINQTGQNQDMTMDYVKYERMTIKYAIKKIEPEVKDIMTFIDNLEVDEAKKIVSKALKLNPM